MEIYNTFTCYNRESLHTEQPQT